MSLTVNWELYNTLSELIENAQFINTFLFYNLFINFKKYDHIKHSLAVFFKFLNTYFKSPSYALILSDIFQNFKTISNQKAQQGKFPIL